MKWCNNYGCWCDEAKEKADEEECDFDCDGCNDSQEVEGAE